MRYFIAHLLSGDTKVFHERITRELSIRYRIFPLSEHIPPHITLKLPFEADDEGIKEVERILRAFAKGERAVPLALSGFGHFGFRTMYIDVPKSPEAAAFVRRTLKTLNGNIEWMPKNPLEGNKLHASIARFLTRRQSRRIRRYLSALKQPHFEVMLDNIAILKKDGRAWRLHALVPLHVSDADVSDTLRFSRHAAQRKESFSRRGELRLTKSKGKCFKSWFLDYKFEGMGF